MNRSSAHFPATFVVALATAVGSGGCGRTAPAPSASASAAAASAEPAPSAEVPVVNALPQKNETVRRIVNPNGEMPYQGPTGTVRGVITVKGDPAPTQDALVAKIPDSCKAARYVYGRAFREGMMRSLGDALVTVTDFKGFLPAKTPAVTVVAKDCAWPARTIALTYGQRLEVKSGDTESYVPKLIGADMRAEMVAVPGHDPVKIYPQTPGRYTLVDSMRLYSTAEVFVLKYPTFAVTGLDGKYEITGVPVGEVTVSALLPVVMQSAQATNVKVEADKVTEVNLEITFDKSMLAPPPGPDAGAPKKPIIH